MMTDHKHTKLVKKTRASLDVFAPKQISLEEAKRETEPLLNDVAQANAHLGSMHRLLAEKIVECEDHLRPAERSFYLDWCKQQVASWSALNRSINTVKRLQMMRSNKDNDPLLIEQIERIHRVAASRLEEISARVIWDDGSVSHDNVWVVAYLDISIKQTPLRKGEFDGADPARLRLPKGHLLAQGSIIFEHWAGKLLKKMYSNHSWYHQGSHKGHERGLDWIGTSDASRLPVECIGVQVKSHSPTTIPKEDEWDKFLAGCFIRGVHRAIFISLGTLSGQQQREAREANIQLVVGREECERLAKYYKVQGSPI